MLSHRYLPKPDDMGPDPEPLGARFDAILQAEALSRAEADLVQLEPLPPVADEIPAVPLAA